MSKIDDVQLPAGKQVWETPAFEVVAATGDVASAPGVSDDEQYSIMLPS